MFHVDILLIKKPKCHLMRISDLIVISLFDHTELPRFDNTTYISIDSVADNYGIVTYGVYLFLLTIWLVFLFYCAMYLTN